MIRPPTVAELKEISNRLNFHLDNDSLEIFCNYIERDAMPAFAALDSIPDQRKPIGEDIQRDTGHFPSKDENPLGAWAWKCNVRSKNPSGLLAGKRVALKDNVSLAGIPMTNGTPMMKDYTAKVDAEVAWRIIAAGGEITGKATCENFCWSGGSHTSYPQPVLNPHNPEVMAGGSSSGSAALVAAGEVDMAIGADQGGSIRIPSSWCGVFGLKPTYGLVPYTGLITGEMTFDHTGPIARTVEDIARLLQVIAGRDGSDPRQAQTPVDLPRYFNDLRADASGLKIGLVKEGFGWNESEPDVDEAVREAALRFDELGAKVSEVSIPIHRKAALLMLGIDFEGSWRALSNKGINFGAEGFQDGDLATYLDGRVTSGTGYSTNAMLVAMFGQYLIDKYNGEYYAKGQNVRPMVRKAYDDALSSFDLLVMPTTPQKAQPFPKPDDVLGWIMGSSNMTLNVAPFDYTGNPAMNVPCGMSHGLPVGMMLVGRHFAEQMLLDASLAFQKIGGS